MFPIGEKLKEYEQQHEADMTLIRQLEEESRRVEEAAKRAKEENSSDWRR